MIKMLGSLLIVRLHRLTHLPPAQYGTEILRERGVPIVVAEIGEGQSGFFQEHGITKLAINPVMLRLFGPLHPLTLLIFSTAVLAQQFVKSGKPRFLMAHGLLEQVVVYLLSLLFNIAFAAHVHEVFDSRDVSLLNRFFLSLEGLILRRAQFLIFPGEERRNIYVNRYGLHGKTLIVPNCPRKRQRFHKKEYRSAIGIPETALILLYLGGIGDSNAIVEAVIALRDHPTLHFVIAGWCDDSYRRIILGTAHRFGVAKQVHLIGPVKTDKWLLLESADITYCIYKPLALRMTCNATPSNKLMESMAAGVPVLAGVSRDFATFLEKTNAGIYTDSFAPQAISAALRRLVDTDRTKMGESATLAHTTQYYYEYQFEKVVTALSEHFEIQDNNSDARKIPATDMASVIFPDTTIR